MRSIRLKRRQRQELIELLEGALLNLSAGWDLATPRPGKPSFRQIFETLKTDNKFPSLAPWWDTLLELHQTGAPLLPALEALVTLLRNEEKADWEHHERVLPTRVNLILLTFFLPPIFLLLFGALLGSLANHLKSF